MANLSLWSLYTSLNSHGHDVGSITGLHDCATNGNASTVNGKTVLKDVPSDAKFTDTIYTHPAVHSSNQISGMFGTSSPSLEINDHIDFHTRGSNNDYDVRLSGTNGSLSCSGTFRATKVYNAVWNDYAEVFEKENTSEDIKPGDIVSWSNNGVSKSKKLNDKAVIGVYSDSFGMLIGGEEDEDIEEAIENGKYCPIGLVGRVMVNVVGDIEVGDLITTSHIPGVGCKVENYIPGTVIGKALEKHEGNEQSKVKILIQNL